MSFFFLKPYEVQYIYFLSNFVVTGSLAFSFLVTVVKTVNPLSGPCPFSGRATKKETRGRLWQQSKEEHITQTFVLSLSLQETHLTLQQFCVSSNTIT